MLGAVLAAVYLLLIIPIADLYSEREATLADRKTLLLRLQAAESELPADRARLAELQAVASTRRITLEGASDAIASANLQSRIGELATAAAVAIGSTEELAAESRGEYRRVGLRVAVRGEYEALVKFLGALETATPPLVVNGIEVHAQLRPGGDPLPGPLAAVVDVYGFRGTDSANVVKQ